MRSLLSTMALLLVCPVVTQAAPPNVTHLFPVGVQRGQEVTSAAAGSFAAWPTNIWTSHEGVKVVAAEEKGKLTVAIAEGTPPGRYWVRCYDAEGAAKLKPLLVGTLAEVTETESNNSVQEAQKLAENTNVNGRFEKGGDVDCYAIEVKQGQTLVASMSAERVLGSAMDGVLQICSADGFVLAQNDDARGIDPQVTLVAPTDGTYIVRSFCFPKTPNSSIGFAGNAAYVYRLAITTGPFIDHAFPLAVKQGASTDVRPFGWNLAESQQSVPVAAEGTAAPLWHPGAASWLSLPVVPHDVVIADEASSPDAPQQIALPTAITGRIETVKDSDVFHFAANEGTKLTMRVEAETLGFVLDPWMALADSTGKVLAEVDDTNRQRDCEIKTTISADGDYQLTIRDMHLHGGFRYVYRLTIEETKPRFRLKLAADSLVVKPSEAAELTVNVERLDGFNEPIEISARDLPDHVKVEPVTSAKEGDSAKAVKLVFNAEATASSSPFTVVGKSGETEVTAVFAIDGLTAEHSAAWLTVLAK